MRRELATIALVGLSLSSGATWQAVEDVQSPAGPGSGEPSLAVDSAGTVYMSWLEPSGKSYALRFASFNGRTWSAPRTVRTAADFFVNWADFPSIEVLGKNRLAVHWLQRVARSSYAYHARVAMSRDGGATWRAPVTLHTDTSATEHGFVALWRDGDGLGAVWLDGRKYDKTRRDASNEMTVRTTTVAASGRRGHEVVLDARSCDCCQTAVTVTSRGPVVAYRDRSEGDIRDIYVVRRLNGRWTEPARVHDDHWQINACPVNGPAIASQGNRVALAWFTAANDSPRVKLAFSTDAGATFGPPVRIDDGSPAGRVDVAALRDGSAIVSWIERTGGDTAAVRARRVHANGSVGPQVTVATSSAARASGFPRMAVSASHAYFAYTVPGRGGSGSSVHTVRIPLMALP